MRKLIRFGCVVIFLFAIAIMAVHAFTDDRQQPLWASHMYTAEVLDSRVQGLTIEGRMPVITESGPTPTRINNEIEAAINTLTEGARRIRARSVNFDFTIHNTNEIVSIVITATSRAATTRTSVLSVNFSPLSGDALTLSAVTIAGRTGRDITPLAEAKIAEMIRNNPATYHAAFNAPPLGQAFYVTRSSIVLLYDDFQLSSSPNATTSITFNRDNIRVYFIPSSDFRVSQDRYAIKMMPLRRILEGLGHRREDIQWCSDAGAAMIFRSGRRLITLTPGENNYQFNGVMQRSLEAAPVMMDGDMFVPISFFDQILSLTTYTIDSRGITFMAYLQ